MDIWGIPGVQAEAELLAAMITLFQNVGLTQADVGIKINSRLVLAEVLTSLGIPSSKFAATCVLVDKLEKVPIDAIQGDLEQLGLDQQVVETLLQVLSSKSLEALTELLGPDSAAIQQLQEMLQLCDAYGMREWIVLDASVVRGLAYYTGIVFEAFDRQGQLRAIAGGGRYDTLLQTFGANEPCPAAGFGFGDAVIVELLQDRKLLPTFEQLAAGSVDSVVYAMTPTLYPVAIQVAGVLRQAGQSVDVVLDPTKKTKWVFKHADRLQANYCVLVAPEEYERKEISIKNLMTGQQTALAMEALSEWARTSSSSSSSSGITNSGKGSGSSGSHEE
jgi:histidyl-tRNA synthetase